ncbi:MAG TPA: sigma 54-interacting transcriptional regulator [Anaeromyxobacteraceae bacterium]|nr:sigma 54-interacting transcriptional regulator [Anaeromyxobacteraceae bacterium]
MADRLAALVAGDRTSAPATGESPPHEAPAAPGERSPELGADLAELLPLLERLASGELRHVEGELLALMASGRVRTQDGRAMAAQALARITLLARADVGGAFALLIPQLPELERLSDAAQLELLVTAALVFSWPDGRFHDAGRANAYLAGAERLLATLGTPENRALLLVSRVTLALLQEDPERVADALGRATELEPALSSGVQRTLLQEARAQATLQAGRFAAAARSFQGVADEGALTLSRVRALGQLAAISNQDGRAPREALALVERARELERGGRLQPGLHDIVIQDAAGAALGRAGRFAEAARVLEEAIDLAGEVGWTPAWPALTLAQLHVWTGSADALRALGDRLAVHRGTLSVSSTRALVGIMKTAADLLGATQVGDGRLDALERQVEELEREVGWHALRGQILLTTAVVASRAGTPEEAERALRRADRHFEREPAIWPAALLRRARGVLLARQGRLPEARQLLEAAAGTLALAEDVANAAHARLMLARVGDALGDPGARSRGARERDALRQLGWSFGLDDLEGLGSPSPPPAAAPATGGCLDRLVAPIQRLATRGLSPALIRRELVALAGELTPGLGAEGAVCLEELDSAGRATPVLRTGPEAAVTGWVELGDGAGRRLRLGVGGPGVGGEARGTLAALAAVAELALERAELRGVAGAPAPAGAPPDDAPDLPGFISVSRPMRQLKADLVRLSRSRATVIVTGESGSGKEVIARAIHDLSTRAGKPYVAFNCAAVPRELFEGQLFGYRKGAFTGAAADQPGVLRAADGGTVLLDEIGELPLDVQPKLLRFLENGEILPLGERQPAKIDVRVIAATFRDLEDLVRERRFREDLYYRLQVVPLRVPPLRERPEDVIALARHFVRLLTPAGHEPPVLAPDALAALTAHRWPGNVRELRNVIERSLAFEPLPTVLGAEHLRITA